MSHSFLLRFLSVFILFLILSVNGISQDFKSSNLFPVYGKKHYNGKKDNDAKVEITSKGNELEVLVSVKDDSLVWKNDFNESDHIELWFSMDSLPNDYFVYENQFYYGDTVTKSSRKDFIQFLEETGAFDQYIDEYRETQTDLRTKPEEIPIVKELTGLVHWGIDVQHSKAFQFDREFYSKVNLPESLDKYIVVQKEIVKGGYNVKLTFKPEALLFFNNPVNNRLFFIVDVFDVDVAMKDLSVLSTAEHKKWGAPETFSSTSLTTPLKISEDLNPYRLVNNKNFYFFDSTSEWNFYYRTDESQHWYDTYWTFHYSKLNPEIETKNFKIGVQAELIRYYIEEIQGFSGIVTKIKFQNQIFETRNFACYESSDSIDIQVAGKNQYAIQTTSCSMRNPWGMGICGACEDISETFYILKNDRLNTLLEIYSTPADVKINIEGDPVQGDIIKLTWLKKFSGIEIQTHEYLYIEETEQESDKCYQYLITWDKNFQTKRVRKEIPCPKEVE
jgi:hypothetical protein